MPRGEPVTPETRAQVIALHGQQKGRNEIARLTGISTAMVTRICRREGLAFDRTGTELATRAQLVNLEERRIALAQKMMVVAEDVLAGYDQPYTVFSFSKDGDFSSKELDAPPIEARRSMVVTAAIAFDKATKVVEKSNPGLGDAIGVLDTISAATRAAVEQLRARAGETTDLDDDDDGVRVPDDA